MLAETKCNHEVRRALDTQWINSQPVLLADPQSDLFSVSQEKDPD